MTIHISKWDPSEYLETEEDILAYLNEAFADGDPTLIQAAIGHVAKAKGMTEVARNANLSRESLYKSLRVEGNPTWSTISKVLGARGFTLEAKRSEPVPVNAGDR